MLFLRSGPTVKFHHARFILAMALPQALLGGLLTAGWHALSNQSVFDGFLGGFIGLFAASLLLAGIAGFNEWFVQD